MDLHWEKALEARKARRGRFEGLGYVHFTDDHEGVTRGTVAFEGTVIHGYPHIGRVLALRQGLREQFPRPFWVEEKIDGYNVRIARVQSRVVALTRGGFICPFTTDRLPDLMDLSVFEAEPDLVVCAEVAGPDNPYLESSAPFVPEDVRLFVFDLMRTNAPGFVSHAEKAELAARFDLPRVTVFGRFGAGDVEAIQTIVKDLNEQMREGVVFKEEAPDGRRAKYVTSNSGISDIRTTAYSLLELPAEYFIGRVLRLVLFMDEQGLEHSRTLDGRLGAAFLDGLMGAIRQFHAEGKVYQTFRCRFRERRNAQLMVSHLKRAGGTHVHLSQRALRQEGGYWVLEFDRVYPTLNGLLQHLLSGGLVFD
ncbi:MAG TPA: RNA ligase [Gammaproteobacteria bacterium]|nr:RNA ligase [Gammaproteobacteria bacterium]